MQADRLRFPSGPLGVASGPSRCLLDKKVFFLLDLKYGLPHSFGKQLLEEFGEQRECFLPVEKAGKKLEHLGAIWKHLGEDSYAFRFTIHFFMFVNSFSLILLLNMTLIMLFCFCKSFIINMSG